MATTKKFLDLNGLQHYDEKIKGHILTTAQTEAGKVENAINTKLEEYKVKNVNVTPNDKVSLTLTDGVVGVTVDAAVVKDSEYFTKVKVNANNSAAAWNNFLKDSEAVYPDGITPGLKDLATTANVTSAIATAKSEAITEAGRLDGVLKGEITTAYQGADTTLKNTLIGATGDASDKDTIYGAKKYADEKAADAKAVASTAQAAAEAAQSTADTAVANAATAQTAAEAAQSTANGAVASIKTINETTIPNLKTGLESKITANTNLINSTKADLIGTEGQDGNTIFGVKKYADDLADGLSTRIDSIVAGGVAFKGVVVALPENPQNGDLIIVGKEGGIEVGGVTYKKDYEYIYSNGAWYELGDSDKNAKEIVRVDGKVDANKGLIDAMDAAYKQADSEIKQSIETLSNAAVKSVEGGNSTYVTVSASAKDETGKVTLTVSDSIAATFDTIESVNSKISTAKTEVSGALIGKDNDGADALTIKGAKKYADGLVSALDNSFVAITNGEIDALFTA